MEGRETMVLLLQAWLIIIPVMFSPGRGSEYFRQRIDRKLVIDNPGFISIDCGATEDYYDESIGIFYTTDAGFIEPGSGEIGQISSVYSYGQRPWSSLRSFPTGIKNCYTLKPEQGKNNKYLIRALFLYGNYDDKNQNPTFEVYLGVNLWGIINASRYLEGIYVPLTDYINVCLVNIDTGIPFISTLELRPVNSSIYQIGSSSEMLHLTGRYDVGSSTNDIMRYKDDVYDRFWQPLQLPDPENFEGWHLINISSTTDIRSSNDTYKPPAEVLKNAAQTLNASSPLNYYLTTSSNINSEYCVYFHFAEISEAKNGQLRKQYVSSNGVNLSTPVTLEYMRPITIGPLNLPVSEGNLQFSVHATEDSDLPPILNAFEIFTIYEIPLSPTHEDDVDALMDIKQKYGVTRNWQGDPCIPHSISWEGLNCSIDRPPRIISLNLTSSGLAGNIAISISNLTSLQSLDLSYNKLNGPLPEFLAQLPFLKELDLSYNKLTGPLPEFLAQLPFLKALNLAGNKLTGSVPQDLREKSNNGTLQLSLDENPDICLLGPCKNKRNMNYVVPVVASVSVLVLLVVALAIWWSCKKKRQGGSNEEGSSKSKKGKFTYSQVVSITKNFKTVLGEGGFGKVYLGSLKNGNQVAVKLLSPSSSQGSKEFHYEVQLLMRVHHVNLVSLIGYCDDGKDMALIYEYMANGNLRQQLSETNTDILNWKERLRIAIDAAQGLEYLHNGCKPPIVHRDLKTSNILLTESKQAKIADFGLSRDFKDDGDTHVSTTPAGTLAYVDPEHRAFAKYNKKSDVYSFGIVLLELITGQPAIIKGSQNIHIIDWISPGIERGDIRNIVDQRLQGAFDANSAWKAVEIAMSCVPSTAIQRPDMSVVVVELKECFAIEMASERNIRMQSNMERGSNSLEMASMDIENDYTTLSPR